MSRVAQKQDISDPEVIKKFAEKVVSLGPPHRARYLITVADIRATGPKVWNSWKSQIVGRTVLRHRQFLARKIFCPKQCWSITDGKMSSKPGTSTPKKSKA